MVKRVLVRSRSGNFFLAIVGALYALSSVAVLAWLTADLWNAPGAADFLLQIALAASAICGIWFVHIAYASLGHHRPAHK